MNQRTPYALNPKSVYARTKIAAERRVLAANGQDGLYTCSIRADGIYGVVSRLSLCQPAAHSAEPIRGEITDM